MTDDIYAKQQFGGQIGFGRSPALLIIDFVNGFNDPGILGGGNIDGAIGATVPLLAFFRERRLPVIFTRIVYAADGSDASLWCQKVPRLRDLTETSWASQIVDRLAPLAGEMVVRKTQASAFFGTHLGTTLAHRGIDTLVIAGCTTSGCVRATAIDGMGMNFRLIIAEDCVGDRAPGPHEANLFDMRQKYADLMTAQAIMAALSTDAPAMTA